MVALARIVTYMLVQVRALFVISVLNNTSVPALCALARRTVLTVTATVSIAFLYLAALALTPRISVPLTNSI